MKSLEDEGESDVDAEVQKAREPPAGPPVEEMEPGAAALTTLDLLLGGRRIRRGLVCVQVGSNSELDRIFI